MSNRPRRAAAQRRSFAEENVEDYEDEYSSDDEAPKAKSKTKKKAPKASKKPASSSKLSSAGTISMSSFVKRGVDMHAAGRVAPKRKAPAKSQVRSRRQVKSRPAPKRRGKYTEDSTDDDDLEESASEEEEEEEEEEEDDAESSDGDEDGSQTADLERFRFGGKSAKSKSHAAGKAAARKAKPKAKPAAAKKKDSPKVKGKYTEDDTDHSSDEDSESDSELDEDEYAASMKYAVYDGLKVHQIWGWKTVLPEEDSTEEVPKPKVDAEQDFLSEGPYMAMKVRRHFGGTKYVDATVIGYLPASPGEEELWHVVHADGDVEDLDREEMCEGMEAWKANQREFYVKWRDYSHRELDWVPIGFLQDDPHRKQHLKKYQDNMQAQHKDGDEDNVPKEMLVIKKVIGERQQDGTKQYLVLWGGETDYTDATWEEITPSKNLLAAANEALVAEKQRPVAEDNSKKLAEVTAAAQTAFESVCKKAKTSLVWAPHEPSGTVWPAQLCSLNKLAKELRPALADSCVEGSVLAEFIGASPEHAWVAAADVEGFSAGKEQHEPRTTRRTRGVSDLSAAVVQAERRLAELPGMEEQLAAGAGPAEEKEQEQEVAEEEEHESEAAPSEQPGSADGSGGDEDDDGEDGEGDSDSEDKTLAMDADRLAEYRLVNSRSYKPTQVKRGRARLEDSSLTSKEGKTLYDYQQEGVNWILTRWGMKKPGCMLADEMGLGKTAQTVSVISHLHEHKFRGPFLIVAPKSVIGHWCVTRNSNSRYQPRCVCMSWCADF